MAWGHKRAITIDKDLCGTVDSTDFPMLFYGTYDGTGGEPDLRSTGNGGHIEQASAYDIAFYSDVDCTSILDFERVGHNLTTGAVEYWVEIPTLDVSDDTVIYMAYGDSGASDLSDASGTWNSLYLGVYHYPDGSTVSFLDSTANNADGTGYNTPTATTGTINGGLELTEANSEYIKHGDSCDCDGHHTFSFWIYIKSIATNDFQGLLHKENQYSLVLKDTSGTMYFSYANSSKWNFTNWGYANLTTTTGTWYKIDVVLDASYVSFYKNGTYVTQFATWGNPNNLATEFTIGCYLVGASTANFPANVYMDEVRVIDDDVTTSYITADYNSQNSPSTFYAIGAELITAGGLYMTPNTKWF